MLISISAWFEKRILSRNPSFLQKEFKKSKSFQERRMYYSYTDLSDLLAISYFNIPQFLPIPEWIIWSDKYGDENDVAKAVPKKGVTARKAWRKAPGAPWPPRRCSWRRVPDFFTSLTTAQPSPPARSRAWCW